MTHDPGDEDRRPTEFWQAVRELAAMRAQIPEERRAMSAVRAFFADTAQPRKDDEMRDTPLITFTKADDSGCGTRDPGDLDYIVHGDALTRWLGNGRPESGEDVPARAAALAKELRDMADHLVRGTGPVAVSCEFARKRYAERFREAMPRMNEKG